MAQALTMYKSLIGNVPSIGLQDGIKGGGKVDAHSGGTEDKSTKTHFGGPGFSLQSHKKLE